MRTPHRIASLVPVLLLATVAAAFAQGVAINGTGVPADTSAILDLTSTAKGFLPPRLTALQRAAIVTPATGLLVYQTDGATGLWYNAGTPAAPAWKQLVESASLAGQWLVNGSAIHYDAGNVGIGRGAPVSRLDVLGGNWDVVNGEGDFRIGDANTRLKMGIATSGGGLGGATIMEQGPLGGYNTLILGAGGNPVFYVDGATQRVGIGVDHPNAPLAFASTIGKKQTLFAGLSGDYGIGIGPGRLQLYSEATGTDVALGYDNAGAFVERLAVKNNGAIAVSGSTGTAGQVLRSAGPSASATWASGTAAAFAQTVVANSTGTITCSAANFGQVIPGLTTSFTCPSASVATVSWQFYAAATSCLACGPTTCSYELYVDGSEHHIFYNTVDNGIGVSTFGHWAVPLAAGAHTIDLRVVGVIGPNTVFLGNASTINASQLEVQVVSQ